MSAYKIIGALGLVLISIGIIIKNEKKQDILFIAGGVGLGIYSIYIKDAIFITLQIIFTGTAVYELFKIRNKI